MSREIDRVAPKILHQESGRWFTFVIWLLLLLIVTYGSALTLPFFFDDLVHIPFIDSHSLGEIWRTSGGLAYYRPLSFTIWKIMFWAIGRHDPFLQHALNLSLHVFNAFMVGWLAGDLFSGRTWLRRFLAASLFLIYPFSYQAVPWAGSMSHLLVTLLILVALITYRWYRQGRGRRWALASLLVSALAPYAHETGVLIGPLVAVLELTVPQGQRQPWPAVRRAFVWSLPALAWLPFWLSAPKSGQAGLTMPSLELFGQNAIYFAQGIGYPLTWLGGWIHRRWGGSDLFVAGGLAAVALVVAALIQTINRSGRRSALPWLWCSLAVMPAILTLSFDYVINGPRLLMVASVGAAWLWTDAFVLLLLKWEKRSTLIIALAPVLILPVMLGAQNLFFVRERMDLYQRLGDVIEQVVTIGSSTERAGRSLAVVNFPSWLAPWDNQYAVGHEGVLVWPDYARRGSLVQVHTGEEANLILARWDAVRSEIPYRYGVAGEAPDWPTLIAGGAEIFLTRYEDEAIEVVPVGALGPMEQRPGAVARFLDDDGRVGLSLLSGWATVQRDGRVLLDLRWQAHDVTPQTTVFVHLLDGGGGLVAQADGDPFGGLLALERWPTDMIGRDLRLVQPGSATIIRVGLYNRATGERVKAIDSRGADWPDQAVTIAVPVTRPPSGSP